MSGSPPGRPRAQLIVRDLKKKNQRLGRGRGDASRKYRTARTDAQDTAGLATPRKTPEKNQPAHLWGLLICKLKGGGVLPALASTLQDRPRGVSSAPAYLCGTALPVLPASNEKLVNS